MYCLPNTFSRCRITTIHGWGQFCPTEHHCSLCPIRLPSDFSDESQTWVAKGESVTDKTVLSADQSRSISDGTPANKRQATRDRPYHSEARSQAMQKTRQLPCKRRKQGIAWLCPTLQSAMRHEPNVCVETGQAPRALATPCRISGACGLVRLR